MNSKRIFLSVLIFAGCLTSAFSQDLKTAPSPFNVSLDMSEEEVRILYSDCQFVPGSPNYYGLCDDGNPTFDVVRNDSVLFYFWNNYDEDGLGGFILLDPNQSFKGIHIGMTVRDVLNLLPEAKGIISHLDESESIFTLNENSCWFKLNTKQGNYAAEYIFDEGEYQFIRFKDYDARIVSIFVKSE